MEKRAYNVTGPDVAALVADAIDGAKAHERERCARIADKVAEEAHDEYYGAPVPDYVKVEHGKRLAAKSIAEKIRSGEE